MTALLERDAEGAVLDSALAGAAAGRGGVVLVSGEAGIGKTSLVRAFARRATGRVLVGACDDLLTPRTLGPLRDAARAAGGPLAAALADGDRDAVLTAVLGELAGGVPGPTVLVVEDVHWADDATLDVLRYLGRRLHDVPALLVLTYRDEEVGPALQRVLGSLAGADVHRLPLGRLSRAAVATLTGGTTATSAALYRSTGGNPFFVTEVVAAGERAVPATVVDAVLSRVRRLPAAAQEALELLAVVPGGASPALLQELVPDLGVLVDAERLRLLDVTPAAVTFHHELARRAVVDALPAGVRMTHHARVLAALGADADPARLVHHAVGAGDDAAVLTHAPVAAARANRAGAHAQEVELLAEVRSRAVDRSALATALEATAAASFSLDRMAAALDAGRAAVALREELGEPVAYGSALTTLAPILWARTRPHEALKTAGRAVDLLEPGGDGPGLAFALAYLGLLHTTVDHDEAALAAGGRAAAVATRIGAPGLQAIGEIAIGTATFRSGHHDAGEALLDAGIARATAAGDHVFATMGHVLLVQDLWHAGRFTDTAAALDAAARYTDERDLGLYHDHLAAYRFRLDAMRGNWDVAEAGLRGLAGEPDAEIGAIRYSMLDLTRLLVRRGADDVDTFLAWSADYAGRSDGRYELVPAHLARIEHAWLRGEPVPLASVELLRGRTAGPGAERQRGELQRWLRRVGLPAEMFPGCPDEFAAGLTGDWQGAAAAWARVGDRYEQALELADAPGVPPLLDALAILDDLGARPAAALVRRRLRDRGVTAVPRGPKPATRANPAGLTDRQLEILRLLAAGATNAEIAARLVLSVRTVDHHVSAVLQKLGVGSRREAAGALASWS